MRSLSRIVWSEGMHLGPHHFQAQSRYFEDSIEFATSALWSHNYGVTGCDLDVEALRNGTVSLTHARGIFSDGLVFNMPESDALPPPRPIGELLSPTRDDVTVLLTIPVRKPDGQNCALAALDASATVRYTAEPTLLADETTGREEKSVNLGAKNIRLMLDTEDLTGLSSIPIARVKRSGSGNFVFDPGFIPPCLRITASEHLMLMLRRLIDIMEDKSKSLLNRDSGGARQGFSTREISTYWFTHAINASLLPLRHLCFAKHGHPEELFLELSRLAGALCTFALDSSLRNLPLYDHGNLDQCFGALDEHIRLHLETIVPSNCLSIPLKETGAYFYAADISDQRCLGRSQWIIAVRAAMGDADMMDKVPKLVKVCSREFVPKLVERAIPGLSLTHLPVPPPAVSASVETQYFGVNKAGPCWDHIVQTRHLGAYVPGEIPRPELELLVILES